VGGGGSGWAEQDDPQSVAVGILNLAIFSERIIAPRAHRCG
jgi:hypothetical protein